MAARVIAPLDEATTRALHEHTENTPLFIVEMVRSCTGGSTPDALRRMVQEHKDPSRRVQAVIQGRVAQLSPSARRLLALAAASTFEVLPTPAREITLRSPEPRCLAHVRVATEEAVTS